jgi:ribonuclease PH
LNFQQEFRLASKVRSDGRRADELRSVTVEMGSMKFARGSALIRAGDTAVLCTASIEDNVPPFLTGKGVGWLTAEYAMLPASTPTRKPR